MLTNYIFSSGAEFYIYQVDLYTPVALMHQLRMDHYGGHDLVYEDPMWLLVNSIQYVASQFDMT